MTKIKLIKIPGLAGSLAFAAMSALNGDFATAAGIVSASLGSASALQGER